ncbi:MAG: AAA family ATPase, partial [Caldimonas sp.]
KTTVCRCFLEQIPKRCNVAYIFNPKLTVMELVKSICDEFHVPVDVTDGQPMTVKTYVDALNDFLLKTHAVGQNNVLIIDEAQMLSADVLEQLRLLTNLETNERKLLQIVLIGQPELRTMLERPDLEQLAQRVIARFHLQALSLKETEHYIRHRLSVAGMTRAIPFDRQALTRIHEIARGVPRRINLLCDRVMLGAYAHGRQNVDVTMIEKAAREVFGRSESGGADRGSSEQARSRLGYIVAGSLVLGALVAFGVYAGWRLVAAPAPASVVAAASSPRSASGAASAVVAGRAASSAASTAFTASTSASGKALLASASAAPMPVAVGPILDSVALSAQLSNFAQDERSAWRELAPLWGIDPGTADPCTAAARQQVRCSKFASTLSLLRQLGRPGIVALRDGNGHTVYATLVGLGAKTVTLRADDQTLVAQNAAFVKAWRGEFGTLWRVPSGYVSPVAEGASGPVVDGLAAQLARAGNQPPPEPSQVMDAALRGKVAQFQSSHGLTASGRAGPTTFMQLNRATGVDEPRLGSDGVAP